MPFHFPDSIWGLSKKTDGRMRKFVDGAIDPIGVANRKRFFDRIKIDTANTVSARLVHGSHVAIVSDQDRGRDFSETDALVTNAEEIVLTITVADCMPVYFTDPVRKAIGLAHAGWKGTRQNIAGATVRTMQEVYRSNPADIHVYIGPHIQAHHFEVREDVASQFKEYASFISRQDGKTLIDLAGIIRAQLIQIGVQMTNIETSDECTFCKQEKYFSYRRDRPEVLEAMVAYVGYCPSI